MTLFSLIVPIRIRKLPLLCLSPPRRSTMAQLLPTSSVMIVLSHSNPSFASNVVIVIQLRLVLNTVVTIN
jgi:hypothetical protein